MADDESDGAEEGSEESVPLGDLADRIRSRRAGTETGVDEPALGSADDEADDDFFYEPAFEEIESKELWDSIDAESSLGLGAEAGERSGEHIVTKRSYCENCEYFSEPPEVHCNHPGTTIVEYVDLDRIRVRNCPIVEQRRELGEREPGSIESEAFE